MGNTTSRNVREETPERQIDSSLEAGQSKKRGVDQMYGANSKFSPEPEKRKKLRRTSEYIYDTLFVRGENSDVTIRSLGKEWKLHKLYLKQANYFGSLYQRQWKDSSSEVIDLQIPDKNIDVEALDITFGSLYSQDILLPMRKVISILAASSLIQLEGLMQQCEEVMKETICLETVVKYYRAGLLYGLSEVCDQCMAWLQTNLMVRQCHSLLEELDMDLLEEVIRSSNFVVIQIEMDIYTLLKKWLYLKLNPHFSGDFKSILLIADTYFHRKAESNDSFFLDTEPGKPFIPVFKALRLQHIIRDFISCREVEKDRIIPGTWLLQQYRQQWISMLRIEQNIETGPKDFVIEDFENNCLRCGRLLLRDTDHCWRWNGHNFGLDLLVAYSSSGPRTITFRRNVRSQRCSSSVSLAPTRHFVFKVTVASVDDKGHTVLKKSTEITSLQLQKEQEQTVLTLYWESTPDQYPLDKPWKQHFPLIISATFQLVSDLQTPALTRSGHSILQFPPITEAHSLGDAEPVEDEEIE